MPMPPRSAITSASLRHHRLPHVAGDALAVDLLGVLRQHVLDEALQHHRLEFRRRISGVGLSVGLRRRAANSGGRRPGSVGQAGADAPAAPAPARRAPLRAPPARRHGQHQARCRWVGKSPRERSCGFQVFGQSCGSLLWPTGKLDRSLTWPYLHGRTCCPDYVSSATRRSVRLRSSVRG